MKTYQKNNRTFHVIEIGDTFGRLTVIGKGKGIVDKTGHKFGSWVCQCSCEDQTILEVRTTALTMGRTKSCGCLQRELFPNSNIDPKTKQFESKNGNHYDLTGEFGKGYATSGEEFWFDLEDYDKIKDYTWNIKRDREKDAYKYVVSTGKNGKRIFLHRLVTNCPKGKDVDHVNHNTLDNRKENLRPLEHYKNIGHCKVYTNNTSGVKGVNYDKARDKWKACLVVNKKTKLNKRFDTFEEAVKARQEAEEKYQQGFRYKPEEDLYNKG